LDEGGVSTDSEGFSIFSKLVERLIDFSKVEEIANPSSV